MNEIKFNNLTELYQRVLPALRSKVKELKYNKINYIKEEDVWEYLKRKKWTKSNKLSLSDMVDDILNTDNYELDSYIKNKLSQIERTIDDKGNLSDIM